MALKLVPYSDILIKDLPKIKELLLISDSTLFIDNGRAQIENYRDKVYIQLNDSKYIGFMSPRELSEDEAHGYSTSFNLDMTGYWRINPIFILPYYQGLGIGRRVLKMFFKDKNGLLWIDKNNIASIKMAESVGFWRIKDEFYINML